MKKIAFIVVVAMCAFWSCNKESVNSPIEKIEFGFVPEDKSIIEKYDIKDDGIFVDVNNTCVTNVNQYPVYAKGKDLKYSSANPAIATIDGLGIVTGVGKGVTSVFAESVDGTLKTELKVYVDTVSVEKVTISCKASSFDDFVEDSIDDPSNPGKKIWATNKPEDLSAILFLNDTAVFSVVTEPLKASFADYVWTSSDPNVLEVNGNVVKAKANGVATLTGNLKYKGTEATKKVYDWKVEEAPLKSIGFAKGKMFVKTLPYQNQPISIIFDPQYASDKSYTTEYYEKDKVTPKTQKDRKSVV